MPFIEILILLHLYGGQSRITGERIRPHHWGGLVGFACIFCIHEPLVQEAQAHAVKLIVEDVLELQGFGIKMLNLIHLLRRDRIVNIRRRLVDLRCSRVRASSRLCFVQLLQDYTLSDAWILDHRFVVVHSVLVHLSEVHQGVDVELSTVHWLVGLHS